MNARVLDIRPEREHDGPATRFAIPCLWCQDDLVLVHPSHDRLEQYAEGLRAPACHRVGVLEEDGLLRHRCRRTICLKHVLEYDTKVNHEAGGVQDRHGSFHLVARHHSTQVDNVGLQAERWSPAVADELELVRRGLLHGGGRPLHQRLQRPQHLAVRILYAGGAAVQRRREGLVGVRAEECLYGPRLRGGELTAALLEPKQGAEARRDLAVVLDWDLRDVFDRA
mmetsp:Transcript_24541/g.64052  ORF Transcript_24541/g.64052 Transcript_24541/m.64052 type:complete len:225 (+) Transcript_24541:500-1174(+)